MSDKTQEELKNLELDRPGRGKSAEQLKKHTLPDNIANRPIDRALQLLTKGDDIQKLNVLNTLPDLCKFDLNASSTRIIPKVVQDLPSASCEFHLAASKSFKVLYDRKLPVCTHLTASVLQALESRDPTVVNCWLFMLMDVMLTLSEDSIRKEVLPVALTKANSSQSVQSRVVGAILLGKLAVYGKLQKDIKNSLLPAVQSLCQDVSSDVRGAMCEGLPDVCRGLGVDFSKSSIISSIVELASDNVPAVKSSAVSTIVTIMPLVDTGVRKDIILPLIKQLCEKSQTKNEITNSVITKVFGRLVSGMLPSMSNSDLIWFINCYKVLSSKGKMGIKGDPALDMVCRDNCAYNLPAMSSLVTGHCKSELDNICGVFRDLAGDPCYIVRKTVASSLHEMIRILQENSKSIKVDVVRLLRDDAEEVLLALVPNLGMILSLLAENGILAKDKSDQSTMEIGRALLKCQLELTKGYNWRLLATLLQQEEQLPTCMPPDFIHQHFAPVVLGSIVNGRARPVREQAARTLLIFLKCNSNESQQKWIRDNLVMQLCRSKSSYTRIIYVKTCVHALEILAPQYFKNFFLGNLISLMDDSITSVQYAVLCILPKLKQTLAVNDPKCKQMLGEALMKLESKARAKFIIERLKSRAKELAELKGTKAQVNVQRAVGPQAATPVATASQQQAGPTKSSNIVPKPSGQYQQTKPVKSAQSTGSGAPKSVQITTKNTPPATTSSHGSGVRKATPASSDMSFLEQHFYVDAGINIPIQHDIQTTRSLLSNDTGIPHVTPMVVSDASDIEKLTKNELETLQNTTTNITDDVKVNLRKFTEHASKIQLPKAYPTNNIVKVNKRHSTIYFSSLNTEKAANVKLQNRRSLNIQPKDFSRIPIAMKSFAQERDKLINKENARGRNNNTDSDRGRILLNNDNSSRLQNITHPKSDNNHNTKEKSVPNICSDTPVKHKTSSNIPLAVTIKKPA